MMKLTQKSENPEELRFVFVIVNPKIRGKGFGLKIELVSEKFFLLQMLQQDCSTGLLQPVALVCLKELE